MIALDSGDKIRGDASIAAKVDYTLHGVVADALAQQADGQCGTSEADFYMAPSNGTIVTAIIMVNTHTSAITCNLYLKPNGGTSRRIIPKDMEIGIGHVLTFDGITLRTTSQQGTGDNVIITTHPVDTFVAEDGALGKGVLLQGDDGTDRKNLQTNAGGNLKITLDSEAVVLGTGSAAIGKLAANTGVDIGDVDVASQPADTFVIEGGAAGKGVLIQGDDGTGRVNALVDAAGRLQVDIIEALPAGSAAIGKLAANSGVDIGDVDVLSLPTLPTGTNAIGKLAANDGVDIGDVDVKSLPNKLTAWTQVVVNISTATTTELIAASAGHTYTILTVSLTIAAENNLTFKSASTAKTGPMDFGASGEAHGWQANFWPVGIKCVAGEALNLTTTTTGQVSGIICVLDES